MIQGSVYLVTGGASGLGKATANLLLSEGACVTVLDLHYPEDDIFKNEDKVLFLQVDVTSEKDISNAMDATKRKFGKLNGVINCAGTCIMSPIYDPQNNQPHSLQEFNKIINVNLTGTFNVIRLAVPLLIENEPSEDGERGVIINTSSILGHQGRSGLFAYSASKAGIIALTYPLAKELSGYGIRVLDIAPGFFETPMSKTTPTSPELHRSIFAFPKRKGRPSEFAHFVKTAIENAMLNGSSVRLDGALRI